MALPGAPTLSNGEPNQEWWAAYRAASGTSAPRLIGGTFNALVQAWTVGETMEGSPEWCALADNTRRNYLKGIERIVTAWGEQQVKALEPRHVLELRDKLKDTPEAANTMIKALASMMVYPARLARRQSMRPRQDVPTVHAMGAWSWEAIEAWRDLAVPELRLAAALAHYTGQRRGDLLVMTWKDVDQGVIHVVHEGGVEGQEKTKKKVWVPIHRDLRVELDRVERRSTRILTGNRGRPFPVESFKTAWQRQHECIELMTGACDGLVLHGLRKSAVCFLLEVGCSEEEVEAITRQSREMIRYYAMEMKRHKLAKLAIGKWEQASFSDAAGENGT